MQLPSFIDGSKLAFHETSLARMAEVEAQTGRQMHTSPVIDWLAFLDCVALCAQLRFRVIADRMTPAERAAAFTRNIIGRSEVEAEVTLATCPA